VTCQHIVGLRNKAMLGSRPLSASRPNTRCAAVRESGVSSVPCRAERHRALLHSRRDDVTCVYVVARRQAAILSDCKGSGRRDVRVLLNNAMTIARKSLTQLGYISEAVSSFSSVPGVTVKKPVLRGVLRVSLKK
jgi:predicted exporter